MARRGRGATGERRLGTEEGRALGRRLGAGTIDQMVSSGTNALVGVVAARQLGADDFGRFGVVTLTYVLLVTAVRSVVCDPMLVHVDDVRDKPGAPLASGVALGAVVGALVAGIGLVMGDSLGRGLLILGLLLPFLVLQDVGRYLGFSQRKPGYALGLDSAWLLLMFPGLVLVRVFADPSVAWLVVVWAGAGALAGVAVVVRARHELQPPSMGWVRHTWSFSWRYLLSFIATYGAVDIAGLLLGAISGPDAVGMIRGAQLLVSPFVMLRVAAANTIVAEIGHRRYSPSALRHRMVVLSLALAAVSGVVAIVIQFVPTVIGEALLGDTWTSADDALLPAGVWVTIGGLWAGAQIGLVGSRTVRETLVLSVVLAPVTLAAAVVGASVNDGLGFFWGLVVAQVITVCTWWWRFQRYLSTVSTVEVEPPVVVPEVG